MTTILNKITEGCDPWVWIGFGLGCGYAVGLYFLAELLWFAGVRL